MNTRRRQAGLSLVELMISITLGLIILSGVLVVFVNTSSARNEVERTSRQIENGRYASELLSEDIRLAGFYGELNVGTIAVPAVYPNDPCSLSPADWRAWMPMHIQGYDDPVSNPGTCALTNRKSGTDVLIIRRARACVAGNVGCDTAVANKGYLQVALCKDQAVRPDPALYPAATDSFRLGIEGSETFNREKKDCSAGNLAGKRQYLVHVYFVATDNGQGQNIPTLMRLELTGDATNPKWDLMPLVEGIEEFQLHYGVDTNNDGVPDAYDTNNDGVPDAYYVADPSAYPATYSNLRYLPNPPLTCTLPLSDECKVRAWMSVGTVQFHILARNLETSPNYTDAKTYHLGSDVNGNPITRTPQGAYRRHIYSGLVRIPNPAGRQDTP